jgi:hypothetical protein
VTILVGICCKDGVVVGSDSSATFGNVGAPTIEQPTRKLDVVADSLILAGTGQIGLNQRFCAQLAAMHAAGTGEKGFAGHDPVEVGKRMSIAGITDFFSTQAPKGQYGALVAFRTRKLLQLCEFAVSDFQPELKNERIWYASMGSGQSIADPFLGFIRKTFWKDGMPNVAEGIFAAAWTLKHTIDLNPGGVNGPIHLATLTWVDGKVGEKHIAKFLDEGQIEQHLESVAEAERYLADFRSVLGGGTVAPDVPLPAPETKAPAAK